MTAAPDGTHGGAGLASLFADPPRTFSPVPIWWWSGDALDLGRLRWQMEQLVAGGVHQAVVLNLAPSGPLYGSLADRPEFFSDAWWDVFAGVCEHAERLGFGLWFYDQLGFSGADMQGRIALAHPSCRGETLGRTALVTDAPATVRVPAGARVLGAYAVPVDDEGRAAGRAAPLPARGGEARWSGTGPHRVCLVHAAPHGFDYLSSEACRLLVDSVHGEFERRVGRHLGRTIVGSFQDELPSMPTWGPGFEDAFARRCGYRIEPHLAALWEQDDDAGTVRGDYQRVRAELAEQAFFRPLFEWHEARGMLIGCDQQHPSRAGYPLESTQQYADYPRTHRWYSAPGSDHWGDAKVHSSLAHLYRRPRTWVEAFHSTGWGGTLEETYDWLIPWLRAGATLYNPHAVYYATRAGTWEWAPPSTCWRQPYWRHHGLFARTVARLCAALTWGEHVCDVGVLFPSATVGAELRADLGESLFGQEPGVSDAQDRYLELTGLMRWFEPRPGVLDRDGRDFDVLDDDSVAGGVVEDAALAIGGERYRALVLPGCRVMEARTLRAVTVLAASGGLVVVCGPAPGVVAGGEPGAETLAAFHRLLDDGTVRRAPEPSDVPSALADLPRRVTSPTPALLRSDGDSALLLVTAGTATEQPPGRVWRTEGYRFDPARYERSVRVTVAGVAEPAALWDPGSGASTMLAARRVNGAVTVEVPLDEGPCGLVVFGPQAEAVLHGDAGERRMARASRRGTATRPLDPAAWTAVVLPTLGRGWLDAPEERDLPYRIATMEHLDGTADGPGGAAAAVGWRPARPTFGQWGWRTGPRHASELPDPLSPDEVGSAATLAVLRDGWEPLMCSPSEGRPSGDSDDAKGYVPEQFLDLGAAGAGDGAQIRTVVVAGEAARGYLTVGASADKSAWWNGRPVELRGPLYYARGEVDVQPGRNVLEIRLSCATARRLRGSWSLRDRPEPWPRPEWLDVAAPRARLRTTLTLGSRAERAVVQFGTVGAAGLHVNGTPVARHGEFDNYVHVRQARVRTYDVADLLREGDNELRIELLEPAAFAVLDADVVAGGRRTVVATDATWTVTEPAGALLESPDEIRHDPRWVQLVERPHSLPQGGRREGIADDPHALGARGVGAGSRDEWFRFRLPPGATSLRLPVGGDAAAFVDGEPLLERDGVHVLASPSRAGAVCLVRVGTSAAATGGGLWDAPAEVCGFAEASIGLGDWQEQGLEDHSGCVRYRTVARSDGTEAVLDLGRVRGTAEVRVNGRPAGCRIWSPYRFEVAGLFAAGDCVIEVDVRNTLAPAVAAVSPTDWVLPGQRASGMWGPVTIETDGTPSGTASGPDTGGRR